MWLSDKWKDYELLDCQGGERLERWGKYILVRPDPQIIWDCGRHAKEWSYPDGVYTRKGGGGSWQTGERLPEKWCVSYGNMRFYVRPMGFKHTGLFPEQAVNWDRMSALIRSAGRPIKVLNLFAYTGGATIACALAGASVCHVDASRGMTMTARENAALSGLADAHIRYIVDDCQKFAERELRRGKRYDAIIMDPPSYGRGPSGEVWKLEENIHKFVSLTVKLLSDTPLFFLINSYTTGLSPLTMEYILRLELHSRLGGALESGELGLPVTSSGGVLPCGVSAWWTADSRR